MKQIIYTGILNKLFIYDGSIRLKRIKTVAIYKKHINDEDKYYDFFSNQEYNTAISKDYDICLDLKSIKPIKIKIIDQNGINSHIKIKTKIVKYKCKETK